MDIEEKLKEALDKLESEPIIEDAKDKVSAKIGKPITIKDLHELIGQLPDVMVPQFREDFQTDIANLLRVIKIVDTIRKRKNHKESALKTKTGVKAAQIAAQRFQRRIDIAEFVLFRVHTAESLFIPLFKGISLPKFRINWKETLKEWNQTHTSDTMTSTQVFRTTFYRIMRETEVLQEILSRELAEEKKFLQIVHSAVEAYKNIVAQLPPDYPIPPKARAMWGMLENMVKGVNYETGHGD